MISKSHWTKALLCPSAPSTPCPRRNLRLCVSSLMRTLLQGSSVPLAPPMGLRFFSSGRKMAHFDFASTSEASIKSPRKTSTHFCSFLTSETHQEKHESIPKLTFGTPTISFGLHPETNGRLPSGPVTVP